MHRRQMNGSSPLRLEDIVDRILAAAAGRDFRTFVIGFARPEGYRRDEHEARYRALKVAAGDALVRLWPDRDVEFGRPDLRFKFDDDGRVSVQVAPLHIAGRYRKHSREIPATRWIHHRCGGRGCAVCNFTGNLCGPSIQEMVEAPVLGASGGAKTLFHGMGREDTDVRMLGRGRPFIIEVVDPVRRNLDLEAIAAEANKRAAGLAEIGRLFAVGPESVGAVKSSEPEKTYRAIVRTDAPPPADAAERAARLSGVEIRQVSPRRVADRRGSETLRRKRIVESRWLGPFEDGFLWEVRTQSGTYVKELVSGDEGRTAPSLSEVLGVPCRTRVLDVLEIHWDPPWEREPEPGEGGGAVREPGAP
jgi:tRNA pseudouridine synthase 10